MSGYQMHNYIILISLYKDSQQFPAPCKVYGGMAGLDDFRFKLDGVCARRDSCHRCDCAVDATFGGRQFTGEVQG